MSKRDTLSVQIKWFYRTNEVPETVYQFLIQNRQTEHKIYHKALALTEKAALSEAAAANNVTTANNCEIKKSKRPKLNDGMLRLRELFVSESTDMHPVSVLRGLCKVYQCHDIKDVEEFTANDNTFFFRLSYNPETRRLASTHGEIQVGASHQVRFVFLTPIWHKGGGGYFYPRFLYESDFSPKFPNFSEVKVDIDRVILRPYPAHF